MGGGDISYYSTLENLTDDFAFLDTCNAEIGIGTVQVTSVHIVYISYC